LIVRRVLPATLMITGTRQLRLSLAHEIRQKISGFIGKKINVVLTDNRVIIGELTAVSQAGITIRNMRQKKNSFPFEQVYEVYFDTQASC
jgi:hypothetical protein